MKKLLQLVIILIFISGCNSRQSELQDLWIRGYSQKNTDSDFKSIEEGRRNIFKFEEDSLFVKNFYYDFYDGTNDINSLRYQILDNTISLFEEEGIDTLSYKVDDNILSLQYEGERPETIIYKKLAQYDLASRNQEFNQLLISSSFEGYKSLRVEFKDDGQFVIPSFNYELGFDQLWMTDVYENELFLIMGGYGGFILHVKSINSTGFEGVIYGKENMDIKFRITNSPPIFDKDHLIGQWIEIRTDHSAPTYPVVDGESQFFERELLNISDSIIQRNHWHSVDTLGWALNRERDLILMPELRNRRGKKFWKIISLSGSELMIERDARVICGNGNLTEQIVFRRK